MLPQNRMLMNKDVFLSIVRKDNPSFEFSKIAQAYDFCCEAHKDQTRKSGEPYAIHPISVTNRSGRLGSYYSVSDYRDVNPEFGTKEDFTAIRCPLALYNTTENNV